MRNSLNKLNGLSKIFRSKYYPAIIKWPTFFIFIVIFFQLSLGTTNSEQNLGSSMTWLFWWTLLPLVFIIFGRIWCSICPFSTLSDSVQKIVGNKLKVPRFLKKYGFWIIIILLIILTWLEEFYEIVDSPRATSIFLMIIFTSALAFGAFYERRAWCRYICPLGAMAGTYSRMSILAVRGDEQICKQCESVECYKGNSDISGCPMYEYPRVMNDNLYCNLCGDCFKSCPNDSINLYIRKPTSELWDIRKLRIVEAFTAIVIMGMLVLQNTLEGNKEFVANFIPGFSFDINYTLFYISALIFSNLVVALFSYISSSQNKLPTGVNFTLFGISLIPLVFGVQVAHNLHEILDEGFLVLKNIPYLGVIIGLPAHDNILGDGEILLFQVLTLFTTFALSILVMYKLGKKHIEKNKFLFTGSCFFMIVVIFFVLHFYLTMS